MRRAVLAWSLVGLVVLAVAAVAAVGWVLSSRVIVPSPYGLMPEFELTAVAELGGGRYAVGIPAPELPGHAAGDDAGHTAADGAARPAQHANPRLQGTYAVMWEGGYAALGETLSDAGGVVTRAVELLGGTPPAAGAPARMDNFYYRHDPLTDLGLPFEDLTLQGPVGKLRAWYVPGEQRTAVLLLHGRRRGELIETLRFTQALHEAGLPVLALAYRNHDASDPSPDGLYHYGASEWQDALVGALELARRGHDRVVLYGLSMGGAVALEALERWPQAAPEVVGLVLDSPLVSVSAVVELGAEKAGMPLPATLTRLALLTARLRTGVDFGGLEQAAYAPAIGVPVLLIAGEDDSTVPIAAVDTFAAAVRSPLTYLRLPGVEHVEAWNHDPARYALWLREFLAGLQVRAAVD
ncbi:MAG: alpha/beta fold hydrolase [Trueperaceae bacterium]|nr:alpha/beta fold hydrolase [Trueperaceae bacterium]